MIIIKSIFSRLTILCILIIYSKRGLVPRVSCSYISDSGDSYWNPRLITLEALMYPLGVNLYEFISALEADVTLNNLKPSEHFTPLIHNRKELLCTIQEMMHERTGSDHCRKDLRNMHARQAYRYQRFSGDTTRNTAAIQRISTTIPTLLQNKLLIIMIPVHHAWESFFRILHINFTMSFVSVCMHY